MRVNDTEHPEQRARRQIDAGGRKLIAQRREGPRLIFGKLHPRPFAIRLRLCAGSMRGVRPGRKSAMIA